MIFKRRERVGWAERAREMFAPRKGWRRGFEYIGRRVQRLPDTPHRIALGFACGAFASCTPFFTMHILLGCLIAWALRGNLIAAALGTFFGNPLTFPAIGATALWLGGLILGVEDRSEGFKLGAVFADLELFLREVFLPYLVGGIAPGLLAGAACYAVVRPVVAAYQRRRRGRLMAIAKARVAAHLRRGTVRAGHGVADARD